MNHQPPSSPRGRGANVAPPNRFETTHVEVDWEQWDDVEAADELSRRVPTEFLPDASRSIITENNSPDIGFRYSINPYRGCEHGCAYCYARPTHETLGLNSGLDFESKILVKHDAPRLLVRELARPSWQGELIALSGVTDCYQPAERRFRLTRQLLEVMLSARQPVSIVTKNALLLRDLDLLRPLAERSLVHVSISVTTLDASLARSLEPRTSAPAARLRTITALRQAGVPVRVMVAPVIPGLNDVEIPRVLAAAAEAGAQAASYILLRLPLAVLPIFQDWLARHAPLARSRVEAAIRRTRGGHLSDSRFGSRMRGQGEMSEQISRMFRVYAKRSGLDGTLPALDSSLFRHPDTSGQLQLFE